MNEFRIFLFVISLIAIVIIMLGNLTIVIKNLSQIVKQSFAINSTSEYWPSVFVANVTARSIISSVVGLLIAFLVYLVILPLIFFRKYSLSSSNKMGNDYFKNIGDQEIKEMVDLLHQKLPNKPTAKNYQLTKEKLLLDVPPIVVSLQEQLQLVANKMCLHLRITKPIRILTLANIPAGKFEHMDGINTIFINSDLETQNYDQKLAILAHEIAHYYLTSHRIYFKETNKNEFLTEVCAIYVGFGFLLLKGYQMESNSKNNTFAKVGYITENVVFDTLMKTAFIRKQNPHWIIKNLSFPLSLVARYRLRPLVKDYNSHIKKQTAKLRS